MRALFGGTAADYVVTIGPSGVLHVAPARLTFWTARTGGVQVTDLLLDGAPVTSITVPVNGAVPSFEGPDGVVQLWADAGGDDRVLLAAQGRPGTPGLNADGTTAEAAMTAVDSDPDSTYRQQQDARLTSSYVGATVMRGTGIDLTGATDSTTAAQALIDAAGVGASVYFPPGILAANELTPLNGQTWWGPGTIRRRASAGNTSVITADDLEDWTLDGPTIDGGKLGGATATSASAVLLNRASACKVTSATTFQNCPTNNAALEIHGGVNNKVDWPTFRNVGYGVIIGLGNGETDECDGNAAFGIFDGVDLNPIFVTENIASVAATPVGRVLNTTVGGVFRNWGDAGIEIGSGCRGATVPFAHMDGGGAGATGLLIRDADDVSVGTLTILNVGAGGSGDGVSINPFNDVSHRINLGAPTVRGSGRYGLFVNQPLHGSTYNADHISDSGAADLEEVVSPWTAPTLLNSWVNFGGAFDVAGYQRRNGRGYLRGAVKNGTVGYGTPILQFPNGFKPAGPKDFIVYTDDGGTDTPARLYLDSTGELHLIAGGNERVMLDLDFDLLPT